MILSVDLGATNIKAGLFEIKGGEITPACESICVPTNASGGRGSIVRALKCAVGQLKTPATEYLAVSSAGDVDNERAVITYATDNLPGMTGFDYRLFGKEVGLEAYAVNDAHAALLGEIFCGAAKQYKNKKVAMLTLGSGVGGAYAVNGRLKCDKFNDYARFGHIVLKNDGTQCTCGKRGCTETYLSGRAIHRRAAENGIDGDELFKLYCAGESAHVKFIDELRSDLKLALEKINADNLFDVCIIGGGVADWMGDGFDKVTGGLGFKIVRAQLGNAAGMYGAVVNALEMRGELL